MSNIIFEKFSRGAGWVAKEVKNTYDEEIRLRQFESDMIGLSVVLIDMGKKDMEICEIINKYFGVDSLNEIREYVIAAHEWISNNPFK